MLENILKDSGFNDMNFKDIVRNFFIDMYENCKPNFFVTIMSLIQTTILICLIIHAVIFRKSNKEKQRVFTISGLGQYSSNPVKLNRKTIMMLFFPTLSCIFYYLTLDLICKTTKKYKYIAWFFSIIIFMNFITEYKYFLALIVIFGAMIFYIYKSNDDEDIKDEATLSGGIGIVLLSIKVMSKAFDILNKKFKDKNINIFNNKVKDKNVNISEIDVNISEIDVKDKNVNNFWKNINKYINNGECKNDEYCEDAYGIDYVCGKNSMCENTELNADDQANFEADRIMALLGLDPEGSVGHIHDHSH